MGNMEMLIIYNKNVIISIDSFNNYIYNIVCKQLIERRKWCLL